MNRNLKIIFALAGAFIVGFSLNNRAISDMPSKIAVVDIQQVVATSQKVLNLKTEQQAKAKELTAFLEKARKEVVATTDVKKKQALEEKYTKELNAKRAEIDKFYTEKLNEIDNSISTQIANQAKASGYDIVIAKGAVLYGGDDITENVKKALNESEKSTSKAKKK